MVYLFLGQEYFLKKQAMERLKSKISGTDLSGLNCDEFKAQEDDLGKIMECAKTSPFMSKSRLVIINDADKFTPEEKQIVISFIENKPACVVVALIADSFLAQDPLYKAALKHGKQLNFDLLSGDELYKWISDRFLFYRKKISPDAARALVNNIGNNLSRLNLAIELLVTFTGERDIVKLDDISSVIGKSLEVTTYQLVEAIRQKNADLALRILQDLDKDARMVSQIVGLIGWHLRRIWRAKKLLLQRIPLPKIAATIGMPQYAKESFFKQVSNFSVKELEKDFKVLLKLDKDIKSTYTQPYRALEFLILQLCANS